MTTSVLKSENLEGKEIRRSEILDVFVPFLKSLTHSFVIALNSPWGTGKTTFVNQCISELGDEYPAIYYNAWKSDYSRDPFIDFCAEILEMEKNESDTPSEEKQNLLDHAKRMGRNIWRKKAEISLSLVSKIGTQELAEACGADEFADEISDVVSGIVTKEFEEYRKRKSSTENFTTALGSFVKKITAGKGPLIIFVDELDRCRPNYAVELLERIKHLFDVENIVFVLSVDLRQLKYAVESIYGSGMKSEGYLKRFFNIVVDIPNLSKQKFCQNLCTFYGLDQTGIKDHFKIYSKQYDITLRQMDRICTLLKIVVGDKNLGEDYILTLECFTMLKILDTEKYYHFRKNKKLDGVFKKFIKDLYSEKITYAAVVTNCMLQSMVEKYLIDSNAEIEELCEDPFWKKVFDRYNRAGSSHYSLSTVLNRLEFTDEHTRTGFDY